MKIQAEHYEALKHAIKLVAPYAYGHRQFIIDEGRAKDIEMRLRWDMLHASKYDVCSLYGYLNDTHIDTALKAIMYELELQAE